MNAQRTIFGLSIVLLFIASTVAADYAGSCCEWGTVTLGTPMGCIGNCGSGTCLPVVGAYHTCSCQSGSTTTTTTTTTTSTTTTTTEPPEACGLQPYKVLVDTQVAGAEGYCDGYCSNGGTCLPTEPTEVVGTAAPCYCKPPVNVPEFATGLVALAVMLLSPAFAYLVVRKRH